MSSLGTTASSPTPSARSTVSLNQEVKIMLDPKSTGSDNSDDNSVTSNRSSSRLVTPLGSFDKCDSLPGVSYVVNSFFSFCII